MKIAHVVHGFPPEQEGGTERYVRALAEAQAASGAEVVVLTGRLAPRASPGIEERTVGRLRVFTLCRSGPEIESFDRLDSPELFELLRACFEEEAPDLVHVHHWQRLGRRVVQAARAAGVPAVVTLHDAWTGCPRAFRVRDGRLCERPVGPSSCTDCVPRALGMDDDLTRTSIDLHVLEHRVELALAQAVLVPGPWHAELLERGDPGQATPFLVLPHGTIAAPSRAPAVARSSALEPLRVVHFGHLSVEKGLFVLIEALERLRELAPGRFEAVLYGRTADERVMARLNAAAQAGLCTYRGPYSPEDLQGVRADWAVFPSLAPESFSFVLDEAFALGLPVIATDLAAFRGRVGAAGHLVPSGDPLALADILFRLIDDVDARARAAAAIPSLGSMQAHAETLLERYADWARAPRPSVPEADLRALERRRTVHAARRSAQREALTERLAERARGLEQEVLALKAVVEAATDAAGKHAEERAALAHSAEEHALRSAAWAQEARALAQSRDAAERDRNALAIDRDRWQAECERLAKARDEALQTSALHAEDRSRWQSAASQLAVDRDGWEHRARAAEAEVAALTARLTSAEGAVDRVQREARSAAEDSLRAIRAREARTLSDLEAARAAERRAVAERDAKAKALAAALEEAQRLAALAARSAEARTRAEAALENSERDRTANERELLALRAEALRVAAEAEQHQDALAQLAWQQRREERWLAELRAQLAQPRLENVSSAVEAVGQALAASRAAELRAERLFREARAEQDTAERERDAAKAALERAQSDRVALRRTPLGRLAERLVGQTALRAVPEGRSPRPKILYVVHQFLPRHAAGTEIYTYRLAQAMALTHDVVIFTTEAHPGVHSYAVKRLSIDGLSVIEVSHQHTTDWLERIDRDAAMERIFAGVLDAERPDLIHVQHLAYHSIGYLRLAKERGVKVVYTLHEYLLLCLRAGQMRRADGTRCERPVPEVCADCVAERGLRLGPADPLEGRPGAGQHGAGEAPRPGESAAAHRARAVQERLAFLKQELHLVDRFLSPSAFLRERFAESGLIEAERIEVSPNGQHLKPFLGLVRRPSADLRVGYIGTIAEYKGVHVLVDAVDQLVGRPGLSLEIYGSLESFPEYAQALRAKAVHPRTSFHGRYAPDAIGQVLAGLDLIVVPSLWYENAPLTIQEAFAAKVPVFASDLGGMREHVQDGVTGRLFPPGDARALAQALAQVLDDRTLLDRWRAELPAVRSIEDDARAQRARYALLIEGAKAR